jgi:hypothetical protein
MEKQMVLDKTTLPALTRYADKLPAAALPHLGSLAHLGLFFTRKTRRWLFRGVKAIFSPLPGAREKGRDAFLKIADLDPEMQLDALDEANSLRQKVDPVEQEYVLRFFRALSGAKILRKHCQLLDPFEVEGEDMVESIMAGTAFRSGGLVSRLIGERTPCDQQAGDVDDRSSQLPTYDSRARELRVGNVVMRRYGKDNYHEIILKGFQKARWKTEIPIPDQFSNYPDRLRETIDQLNTPLVGKPMLIRFGLHDKNIYWKRCPKRWRRRPGQ